MPFDRLTVANLAIQVDALPEAERLLLVNVALVLMLVAFIAGLAVVLIRRTVRARVQAARLAAMGTATARILHQVKNPIQTVILHAGMLDDPNVIEDPVVREEVAEALTGEAGRLSELLAELSMYASGETRRLSPEPLALAELVRDAVAAEAPAAAAEGVRLHAPALAEVEVRADPYFLRHALDNLIRNAREAVSEVRADAEVRVTVGVEGGDAVVRIMDNGPGIPPDERASVFEPFVSTKGEGMGLGLAVVREIVEGHGGTVDLQPRDGGGTVATVTLPVARPGGTES